MILRPYQEAAKNALRGAFRQGFRSPLLVAPTGAGKTVIFADIVRGSTEKGLPVLMLLHREELIRQTVDKLNLAGVRHGIIAAGRDMDKTRLAQVASVHTLVRRLENVAEPRLIIVDEAQHSLAATWQKIFARWPRAYRIGVTATPERLDGRGLGEVFDHLVMGPSVSDLQSQGFLAPTRCFGPRAQIDVSGLRARCGEYETAALAERASRITGNAVAEYRQRAIGRRGLAFCVSVAHAEATAAAFLSAGIPSAVIDGKLDPDTRERILLRFALGEIQVLCSCEIVTEGYDLPCIEAIIGLRPTRSLSLHLQMLGRALRVYPGKTDALILDHAGNIERHGFVEDSRCWSLEGRKSRKEREAEPTSRRCKFCFAMWPSGDVCPQCGKEVEVLVREIKSSPGELQELKRAEAKAKKLEQGKATTMQELVHLGYQRKLKKPHAWASYIWQSRQRRS